MKKKYLITYLLCAMLSAPVWSQNSHLSIDMKNAKVENVLQRIEKQTDYKFSYNEELVDIDRRITIKVDGQDIDYVLKEIFRGTDVKYVIKGNQIILKIVPKADAKKVKVKGHIMDEAGEPMPGVTLVVENTVEGTVSDIDGNFSINIPLGGSLKVSSIGFKTQYYLIKSTSNLNIVMTEDRQVLDEVVVVGYGAVSRKNLTTSISTVKTENINKAATSNLSQMLMGRASGLKANVSSPQPDGKVDLSIRGGGAPLFIVDGVMMPSDALGAGGSSNTGMPANINRGGLAGLNPNDIESIEVLKDASASIYGIGAANGVVLITTKKGKSGKPTITYEGNYSYIQNKKYIDVLNAKEYMIANNVFSKELYLKNNGMKPYGEKDYDGGFVPYYSAKDIANNTIDTDWTDLVLKSGYINNQNVTVTGGSEKFQYYLGLNYFDQEGTVQNSGMKKYAIHTNVSSQLFSFMKLSTVLNYNQNDYQNSMVGADAGVGGHAYGALEAALNYPSILPVNADDGSLTIYSNIPNPKGLLDIKDQTKSSAFYANFATDFTIFKDILTARIVYGVNKENTKRLLYIPSDVYFNQMTRSRGEVGNTERTYQTLEGTVNFKYNFFDVVNFDLMAGMGLYKTSADGSNIYYENSNDQIGNDKIEAAGGPFYPSSWRSGSERRSQFMRANFDFFDKYVIAVTLRRDGTDKFFPGEKYALFPAVSAAWKISNEKFLSNLSWLNLLKFRFSYGLTGRDNLGSSLYGLFQPSDDYYVYFDEAGSKYVPFIQMGRDYPDVSWEKTQMLNVGVDFSVLKDRIWGSVDWFRYDETDMLAYDPNSWKDMFLTRPINGGHYKRVGFDISLNTRNIKTKDFEWKTLLNMSRYQSLWIDHVPNYDYSIWQKREGEPLNAWYYYKSNDIINSDKSNMPDSQRSLPASWQMPGMPIIDDKDGNGIISQEDIYLRDNTPKLYLGFGNTFTYKGFDLDIFMYGNLGVYKYNTGLAWGGTPTGSLPRNVGKAMYESYSSIVNPNGKRVGIAYWTTAEQLPGGISPDIDVENASFIRVRNITLGYTLNKKQLGNVGKFIKNIRIYGDVQNPLCFTNFSIVDPEIKLQGGKSTKSDFPQTITYSIGAKLVF